MGICAQPLRSSGALGESPLSSEPDQCHLASTGDVPIVLDPAFSEPGARPMKRPPVDSTLSRRELLRLAMTAAAALAWPAPALACHGKSRPHGFSASDTDRERLLSWTDHLRTEGLTSPKLPLGTSVGRVGALAAGSPYVPFTLEAYLERGGEPAAEPLTLSLTRFDCVTLVEACLGVGRVAASEKPADWDEFAREVERMRYRQGKRQGYTSRLHYFSE